jgi:PKD repeat protein
VTFTRQIGNTFFYVYSDQNHWEADQWYHVAGVIDPLEGMKLYIDGVLQQDSDPTTQPTEIGGEITTIGCWGNTYSRFFDGEIDEVRFWKRPLNEHEIRQHMCDTINTASAQDLWCYYKMNEGTGTSLINYGEEGTHGNIQGSAYLQNIICQIPDTPDLLWLKGIQGSLHEEGFDIITDKLGHPINCGYFFSDTLNAGDLSLVKSSSSADAFVIKYNLEGEPIWMDNPGGSSWQEAWGLAGDDDNNIYVAGMFRNNFSFADTTIYSSGSEDAFFIKYDSDGNELWCKGMHSAGKVWPYRMVSDHEGNIILGARYEGTLTIGTELVSNCGQLDVLLAKFDPDGNLIWARSFGGSNLDFLMGLTTDKLSNIYFSGGAHSSNIQFGSYSFTNSSTQRLAFIVQTDPDGNVTWAEAHDDGYDQEYFGIAIDDDLNIYTSGYFKTVFNFGPHTIYGSSGHFDLFLAKYNADHEHKWIKKISTPTYGRSDHLMLDQDENLIMETVHVGDLIAEGKLITGQGNTDMTLLKWDRDANLIWTLHAGDYDYERSYGLACGPMNNIYFTGYFHSPVLEIGDLSIQNTGGNDAFIAALGPPCPPPDPRFTYNAIELEVEFTAFGTADTYYWDFGDGTTSTVKDPVHIYDSAGVYKVCLTVQDICGQDMECIDVSLCMAPTADFTFDTYDLMVAFYQDATYADQYQWSFGDGTHSYDPDPVHEYDDYGNYVVMLIVFNDCGADQHFDTVYLLQPVMCNFSFTIFDDGTVEFTDDSFEASSCFWDFGDGTTSTETNPVHQYESNGTYQCCLTIENQHGTYSFCAEVKVETIEEETEFNVYVDQYSNTLKINIPANDFYKIFIFDTWGKPAYSDERQLPANSVYEVGLSLLPPGVYVVSVESSSIKERIKVLVPQN